MARRRKSTSVEAKAELGPSKSPVVFLFFWLAVPMMLMIGYASYLQGFFKF